MASSAPIKSLKIKISTLKRLGKELKAYEKEVQKEEAKAGKMRADGVDTHDLKQQEGVVAESKMMVPNCRTRLVAAMKDVENALAAFEGEGSEGAAAEVQAAREALEEAQGL
eukprot:TRINITY_DN3095_c0_g3_i1.p2 TRINITY_DN3095_c0_g3~~TRINITY_DN3095_c0_g3_i1.p2  ORF type:complete len:112 (+),score=40.82 TRINITY_DN3095_c0_g3_i1:206-541(+)